MTTEALRKLITVTNWHLSNTGLIISYEREDLKPNSRHIILNHETTIKELGIVGSIEDYFLDEEKSTIQINGKWLSFNDFVAEYKMCQWEALSIAIRHESEKELANDLNVFDRIADILNPHK